MRQEDNYVMVKRVKPNQVTLPDGRPFTATFEKVSRDCQQI